MPFNDFQAVNNAQGTLLGGISAGAVAVILQTWQGGRFGNAFPILATLTQNDVISPFPVLKREIVKVTARVGDTLTIVRSSGTCLPSDASTTPWTTAFSFSSGDTLTVTVTAETIDDIQNELMAKLASVWGLRTGFGINRHLRLNLSTGAEESKAVTQVTAITGTNKFRMETVAGDYEDVTYWVLQNDAIAGIFPQFVAGESITAQDAVALEYFGQIGFVNNSSINVGNITANTRAYQQIIGSGVSMSSLITTSVKVWSPSDNWTLTIETDNAGVPSGTLANANATATIAGASFGSWTDNTWTFAGAFTLTLGTKYHIVIKRQNAVDPSNYVTFNIKAKNNRLQGQGLHNGTSYQAATFTAPLACYGTGILNRYLIKASANFLETAKVLGFARDTVSAGQNLTVSGIFVGSGLTAWSYYYLSNTAGAVSLTAGTIKSVVGLAKSTTNIIFSPAIYNPLTNADNAVLALGQFGATNATLTKDYIFSDYGKLTVVASGACNFGYKTDWVTTQALAGAATYTIQFEPNKVYTLSFVGTWWTGTFVLSRTYPLTAADLIY